MTFTKYCRDCGAERPVAEFTRNRRQTDGLAFYCRRHARHRRTAAKRLQFGPAKHRFSEDPVPDGFKWCPDCGEVKPLGDFPKKRSAQSGYYSYCKPCHNIRGKLSKEKVGGSRTYHLKRRYGITAGEADAMLEAQSGLCAICRTAPAAHVDHDHLSNAVRDLLCFNCNGGLGQFKDDPEVLRAAADYVERHRALPRSVSARPEAGERPGQRWPDVARDRRCSHGFARWKAMHEGS